jgi:ORF6N domain
MARSTAPVEVVVPLERIASRIYVIRGLNVMLDSDLAELYGVLTKNLNLAVRRNARRFPLDFMFQMTTEEEACLRLQIATSNQAAGGRGGRRYLPYVFTEQGVAMLSSVLKSDRAADVNISIMRTFVRLRQVLATNEELARKVEQHDHQIALLFDNVQQLLAPETPVPEKKRAIGFAAPKR